MCDFGNETKSQLLASHVLLIPSPMKLSLGPRDRKEAVNPTLNLHSNPRFILVLSLYTIKYKHIV